MKIIGPYHGTFGNVYENSKLSVSETDSGGLNTIHRIGLHTSTL